MASGNQRLKISEVADILNASPGVARSLLREWGVKPCADYGRGRGRGLRWDQAAVEAAADRSVQRAAPPRPFRRPKKHALDGSSIVEELFR